MEGVEALLLATVGSGEGIQLATERLLELIKRPDSLRCLFEVYKGSANPLLQKVCLFYVAKAIPVVWDMMSTDMKGLVGGTLLEIMRVCSNDDHAGFVAQAVDEVAAKSPDFVPMVVSMVHQLCANEGGHGLALRCFQRFDVFFGDDLKSSMANVIFHVLVNGRQNRIALCAEFLGVCDKKNNDILRTCYSQMAVISRAIHGFEPQFRGSIWTSISAMVSREVFTNDELMLVFHSALATANMIEEDPSVRLSAALVFEDRMDMLDGDVIVQVIDMCFMVAAVVGEAEDSIPQEPIDIIAGAFDVVDHHMLCSALKRRIEEAVKTGSVGLQAAALKIYSLVSSKIPVADDTFLRLVMAGVDSECDMLAEIGCRALSDIDETSHLLVRHAPDFLDYVTRRLVQWILGNNSCAAVGINALVHLVYACDVPISGLVEKFWVLLKIVDESQRPDVVNCVSIVLTKTQAIDGAIQSDMMAFVSEEFRTRTSDAMFSYALVLFAGLSNLDFFDVDPSQVVDLTKCTQVNSRLTFLHNYALATHGAHADFMRANIGWIMARMDDDWLDDRMTAVTACSISLKYIGDRELACVFFDACITMWDPAKTATTETYVSAMSRIVGLVDDARRIDYANRLFALLVVNVRDESESAYVAHAMCKALRCGECGSLLPKCTEVMQLLFTRGDDDSAETLEYLVSAMWSPGSSHELFSLCVRCLHEHKPMTTTGAMKVMIKGIEAGLSDEEMRSVSGVMIACVATATDDETILMVSSLLLAFVENRSNGHELVAALGERVCTWFKGAIGVQRGYQDLLIVLSCLILRSAAHVEYSDDIIIAAVESVGNCRTKRAGTGVEAIIVYVSTRCPAPSAVTRSILAVFETMTRHTIATLSKRRILPFVDSLRSFLTSLVDGQNGIESSRS